MFLGELRLKLFRILSSRSVKKIRVLGDFVPYYSRPLKDFLKKFITQ